jgi:hypothetical protein
MCQIEETEDPENAWHKEFSKQYSQSILGPLSLSLLISVFVT